MKRSELYARVWSMPVAKIADEVGITGTRIATICRQHGIPTPPRGYWAKLSAGKQPPTEPLPSPEADYLIKIGQQQGAPKRSAWVAPGLLLRPGASEQDAPHDDAPEVSAAEATEQPQRRRPVMPTSSMSDVPVDMALLRAAAADLQEMHSIRELLQALAARAISMQPGDARRLLSWIAAIRVDLEQRDPVAALLKFATDVP